MSQENIIEESETLGTFLRNQREQKGLSLHDIADTTKISSHVLESIENDDYNNMPADAFCRGFYSIYANLLGLDTEEILTRYQVSRGLPSKKKQPLTKPPVSKSKTIPNYAEPGAFSPIFSVSMLFGSLVVILICTSLYFGWNSGTDITKKIQNLMNNPEPQETIEDTTTASPMVEVLSETIPEQSGTTYYSLKTTFNTNGILQITLDNGVPEDKHFYTGQTLEWKAEKEIFLSLPEETSVTILLNGVEIPLPEAHNGKRLLTLP